MSFIGLLLLFNNQKNLKKEKVNFNIKHHKNMKNYEYRKLQNYEIKTKKKNRN